MNSKASPPQGQRSNTDLTYVRHQQPHYHHGPVYTEKLKEGPYSHLSIAGVQDVILQVAEPQGRLQSVGPPKSIYFSYSSSPASEFEFSLKASNGKTGSPWVPFRVTLDEDNDPEAMLESLQVIFERRLSMANRIPKNDWVAEDAKAALALSSKKNVQSPIEGAMEQFRYLPMAPTKMNKELVRIRKSYPHRCVSHGGHRQLILDRPSVAVQIQSLRRR